MSETKFESGYAGITIATNETMRAGLRKLRARDADGRMKVYAAARSAAPDGSASLMEMKDGSVEVVGSRKESVERVVEAVLAVLKERGAIDAAQ